MMELCPNCDGELTSSDSGEPDCIGGWWCEECGEFWSDADLNEERTYQEYIASNMADAVENPTEPEDDGYGGPPYTEG